MLNNRCKCGLIKIFIITTLMLLIMNVFTIINIQAELLTVTEESTENLSAEASSLSDWFEENLFGVPAKMENNDLSMDLDHLIDRSSSFDQSNSNNKIDSSFKVLNSTVNQIADIVGKIGRYIMYALILFFGVRVIWSGVEGKSQFKEMLPYLLVGIVFFWAAPSIVNIVTEIFVLDSSTEVDSYMGAIFSTILVIVRIAAFAGIIFTGLKLMFSYSDKKADAKSSLLPVLIGCILVFATSTIVNIALTSAKDIGINTENSIEDITKK